MKIGTVNCEFYSHTIREGLTGKRADVVNIYFFCGKFDSHQNTILTSVPL